MAIFKGVPTKSRKQSRSDRRRGTKAKHRKGTSTWSHARGLKAFGEGASRERHRAKK